MSRYLVINFDRYETEDSTHNYVTADSHVEAIVRNENMIGDNEFIDWVKDSVVIKDDFASIEGEDCADILSYKIIEKE